MLTLNGKKSSLGIDLQRGIFRMYKFESIAINVLQRYDYTQYKSIAFHKNFHYTFYYSTYQRQSL